MENSISEIVTNNIRDIAYWTIDVPNISYPKQRRSLVVEWI